ncbi:Uncharacterised protein [Mycobacteroides abscessus subsp. abscessus]|nr:Uncharacterised protein [Mycobacteroides abscessus subsp. abscessus]
MDIHTCDGYFGHTCGGPYRPVGPAVGESGETSHEFLGVFGDAARDRPVDQQFTQCTHDHEYRQAGDQIGQDEPRSGLLDRAAGAVEEAGTDGTADGDHLHRAGRQAPRVSGVGRLGFGIGNGHPDIIA